MLLIFGVIYACSAPPKRAADEFLARVAADARPPYALSPTDAPDAARSIEQLRGNRGFWSMNSAVRSTGSYTRACFTLWVHTSAGRRFMDVALEEQKDGWKVTDLSFVRDCATTKYGDYRLR